MKTKVKEEQKREKNAESAIDTHEQVGGNVVIADAQAHGIEKAEKRGAYGKGVFQPRRRRCIAALHTALHSTKAPRRYEVGFMRISIRALCAICSPLRDQRDN